MSVLYSETCGEAAPSLCCPIVEIRQYTLTPGSFQAFSNLFEAYFIESQESDGATIIGTFRVLDDPNRFFWIRGFQSMEARKDALTAFYGGPVWKVHREVANEMLVDNDNVLLLRPARVGSGFSIDATAREVGTQTEPPGLMVATIHSLGPVDALQFDELFEESLRPAITRSGARVVASLITEHSENNFPRLPVRNDANVYAWFSCFQDEAAYEEYQSALISDPQWVKSRETLALWHVYSPPETWRLAATPRSALRC